MGNIACSAMGSNTLFPHHLKILCVKMYEPTSAFNIVDIILNGYIQMRLNIQVVNLNVMHVNYCGCAFFTF